MSATEEFIGKLASLKPGAMGLLRKHAGLPLDESVDGFDLFAGLWWPLREKSQKAPRREVAWLVAKLYAHRPIPHVDGATLAWQLGTLGTADDNAAERRQQKFDELLALPLSRIEPALQWAMSLIAASTNKLDWVRLTDQLSQWERESTRLRWANEYLHLSQ
jgi:CRISPR type I-E-associated protein CasB/Cse2